MSISTSFRLKVLTALSLRDKHRKGYGAEGRGDFCSEI